MNDDKGWATLSNSRKWHYFEAGHSLCGRWLRLGRHPLEDGNHGSPDNCKACWTLLMAKKARGGRP